MSQYSFFSEISLDYLSFSSDLKKNLQYWSSYFFILCHLSQQFLYSLRKNQNLFGGWGYSFVFWFVEEVPEK